MSNTAGPAINSLRYVFNSKGIAVAQSGAQTIATGQGTLGSIIGLVGLLSGGGVAASQSGCVITVYDAVSGTAIRPQSGATTFGTNTNGVLYQFSYGTTSGLVTGISGGISLPIAPPDAIGLNTSFQSGLIACVSGGTVGTVGIALLYTTVF
jgi:hypothetical protein